jgi:hypothetical protein
MRWPLAVALAATAVALAALASSAAMFLQLRDARNDLKNQKAEGAAVRGLALDTAKTLLVQHKTIGALVDSQRNLVGAVRLIARRPAPTPARTLSSYP